MKIRKATAADFGEIVKLIDGEFTKEGFGFVNKAQVETELWKGRVFVAEEGGSILGCRIGVDTVWNIIVTKSRRGEGIGRALMEIFRPRTVRVKNTPVGHLSKEQRASFSDPTAFYEELGYKYWGNSYPRNFWQRAGDKAKFHSIGITPHIAIYKDKDTILF